jgi:hypothetical protein
LPKRGYIRLTETEHPLMPNHEALDMGLGSLDAKAIYNS